MPITWTHENVSRLFLVTLAVHHIHMDYKQIAAAFGGDASPRAIEEKMKKLRKEAREFGDGSIDFLVNRNRANAASGNGKGNGKGGVGKGGKNGKGRARAVKYENGRIKWEYDNCEDDSEGEGGLSARGYGDLMECYLLKKENKGEGAGEQNVNANGGMEMAVEAGMGMHTDMSVDAGMNIDPAITGDINCTPTDHVTVHPYYMVDPIFGAYGNSDVSGMQMQMEGPMVVSEHDEAETESEAQLQQMEDESDEAGDINAVMDPMLTNGISSIDFQAAAADTLAPAATTAHGLQLQTSDDGDVGMAWEQNQDLRDLNDEFRAAVDHAQIMPEGESHVVPEEQESDVGVGLAGEAEVEVIEQADVGRVGSEAGGAPDNSASS
ncbi:hypothetical protein Dda_3020 [Drechslerella dactyloides]|uniref:Uncharacterized protein n=1 Tax=Drechslerella dactyloides TaxID=74499 RepID=A0AAD6J2W7_DREDA|nr:hypothetical protein Dda_3020 [Drechslerella dactyloides]